MTTSSRTSLLDQLRQIVGAANVLTTGDLSAWELDWRKRERGRALAVVRPASTIEVATVVKACAAAGVSIVPQGGNTGMVVGSTPDASGTQIVLSLLRMNTVRALDGSNLTITVDAGCVLQTLQEVCEKAGFLFPLSLASEGSCTIGGNLGTNAGGTQVVRYGNTRELCLGLEVVTAQGEIWDGLSGLRKDNTGYDLRHLMIGSEGTLGVITGATMKLYPLPVAQLTAFAAVPSLDAAVQLLGLAHQHLSAGLTGFEVMGKFALSLVTKHFPQQRVPFQEDMAPTLPTTCGSLPPEGAVPCLGRPGAAADAPYCVVLENSDQESEAHARERFERLLEVAMEAGCVLDAVVAESITQARALWHVRESIPLAQAQEGLNIKHDISIAVSRIPEFVRQTDALLQQAYPGARLVNYGHLGDGNLHYNVQAPAGADAEAFLRDDEKGVNAVVYDMVDKFKGSISAEHGVGSLKRDKLEQHKSPVALGMMRAIKQALDPQNTMNPGRVLLIK
nr:FAD-binding oxidoreductase [Rhodoferax sp.]